MAYVGTAQPSGSARDTLASVIAGEAGNEGTRGIQAVTSVIANRANANYGGHGNDYVAQATARMQFQGQASPTAGSYAVADQLLSGQLTDVTGGALYYANPGASTAQWARNLNSSNALQIGNHYFTDNTNGVPFDGSGEDVTYVRVPGADATKSSTDGGFTWAARDIAVTSDKPVSDSLITAIDNQSAQQSNSGTQQAQAIAGAAQTQATTDATIASAAAQNQFSLSNWLFGSWSDIVTRIMVVLLGIVFIAGGLGLIVFNGRSAIPTIKNPGL